MFSTHKVCPGWKGPRGPRSGNDNKTDSTMNTLLKSENLEVVVAFNPLFIQELFEQFLNFAKLQKGADNNHTITGAFVETISQDQGIHRVSIFF